MSRARMTQILLRDVRGTPIRTHHLAEAAVRRSLFGVLEDNVLCSIATVTATKQAHVNTAYFCYSNDLELYFLSHPHSLHCRNISTNRSAAMTIFSSSQPWGSPGKGVQLFGRCQPATGRYLIRGERLYANRFPAYRNWKGTAKTSDAAAEYRFYRFVVRTLKILDEKAIGDAVFVHAAVRRYRRKTRRR